MAGAVFAAVSANELPLSDALLEHLRSLSSVSDFERMASTLMLQNFHLPKPVTPEQSASLREQAEKLLDRAYEVKDAFNPNYTPHTDDHLAMLSRSIPTLAIT